jgi:tRNA-modifying protein YgfZ
MEKEFLQQYETVRAGGVGFVEKDRTLIAVWGKEAVQFLNGMITNDVAKLEDGAQMFAAFPNAQGRLIAVVRVLKNSDKFLFETEAATGEKVFQNLFRFTFAGDFFAENLSENYRYFEIADSKFQISDFDAVVFRSKFSADFFVPKDAAENFKNELLKQNAVEISAAVEEVLRVENGVPKYGVDMDETTIVPELGIENLISYNKGCYIGQEIIARIYFRGHVAKQLRGLILSEPPAVAGGFDPEVLKNSELKSTDGKTAGRISSVTFSPKLGKTVALAYVRYDYLADETELRIGEATARVKVLPLVA